MSPRLARFSLLHQALLRNGRRLRERRYLSTYFSTTGEDAALDGTNGLGGAGSYISLHTGSPSTTGANELTGGSYIRVQTTWSSSASGAKTGSQVTINVPASNTVEYFGIWSAATSGTYVGGGALPSNQTYVGSGTYLLTPTLTATG